MNDVRRGCDRIVEKKPAKSADIMRKVTMINE
jgi:hypothetical protein